MPDQTTAPELSAPPRPESQSDKAHQDPYINVVTFRNAEDRAFKANYCGRGAIVGLATDGSTIVVVPLRCKHWDCTTCGPVRQHRTAARIAAGLPTKFLTLTTAKTDQTTPAERFALAKAKFPILVKRIRAKFGSFEYACAWELSASGSAHAHIAARCDFIPQAWLSSQWRDLTGFEIVDIRAVKDVRKVAYYVCKYMLKHAAATNDALAGSRLLQFSQSYDLELDPEEPRLPDIPFVWKWVDKDTWSILGDLYGSICDWSIAVAKNGVVTFTRRPHTECVGLIGFSLRGENITIEV